MSLVNCNDPASQACLDELVKEINDELSIGCQIPFTVPKRALVRMINRAKDYFYKMYEDSVEEMYLGLPAGTFRKEGFKKGIGTKDDTLKDSDLDTSRGIVTMPDGIFSVNNVFEIGGFSGEDGGWAGGGNSINGGDMDFSIDKFMLASSYNNGAGIASEGLLMYVINSKFMDLTRQTLQAQISYTYNRLTHKFRFQGELPKRSVCFQVYAKVPDCALFSDELFIRYVIAQAKIQLARIQGTFSYNLPGSITINFDMIQNEGQEELTEIKETLAADDSPDYFLTG